jgi:ABC-2 type transport system permease protein
MKQVLALTRKELNSYFGSPVALIFVGVFLGITLFTFFWAGNFWGRGTADVRPLFQWMPLLLIFLIAALTMRQWSEEQQTGTLELLLSMPIPPWQLVLGKFLAVLALVAVALALTLCLPITVALLGRLDPGPVIGGYLASLLLAGAYAAIGLFISSRTDNQLVALILTGLVGGVFYLIGASALTSLVGSGAGELLRALGTGSRFESIERGVIDLRDMAYYLSLTLFFLLLNIFSLDSRRWNAGKRMKVTRQNRRLTVALVAVNLVLFNVLIARVDTARADLTQDGEYTLSPVTRQLLSGLGEPLLVRGYFSQRNHPLLAPLIPPIRDMLREYASASRGKMTVDFLDPITNPELETEANQVYGIRPTPLQVQERGSTAIVNAYFNILIRYGDQNVTLNLLDMIDVNQLGGEVDVKLRNLEYDLTSSIQRTVYGFRSLDTVLDTLDAPTTLTFYVTPNTLPENLQKAPELVNTVAADIQRRAPGKFEFRTVNMAEANAGVTPQQLFDRYQIQPIAASFFSTDTYYLHMVLEVGEKNQVIFPTGAFSEAEIRSSIDAALKRLAPGFLQIVGVWTPPDAPQVNQFGQQSPTLQRFSRVTEALRKNYEVRTVDLNTGLIPAEINALVVIAPSNLSEEARFAIDQFLMRGGSVFLAAGNYQIGVDQFTGGLTLQPVTGGLSDLLDSYGIKVDQQLVLDTRNVPFPIPVQRNVGGVTVQEIQAINYPQFVDVRPDGMDRGSPIVSNLQAVTVNWGSPIVLDPAKNEKRTVQTLLKSSAESWITTDTATEPNPNLYPETGFAVGATRSVYPLAVAVEGSFSSFFTGRQPPAPTPDPAQQPTATPAPPRSFIPISPSNARLVVVGSLEFINDTVLDLSGRLGSDDRTLNNLQFVQNAVDWFVQDTGLASIRARGTSSRLLRPLADGEQTRWEVGNYLFVVLALVAFGVMWQVRKRSEPPMPLDLPAEGATEGAN